MTYKTITFQGKEYTVPEWVSWVGLHATGTIFGYQYEPFELRSDSGLHGWENSVGQVHVIDRGWHKPVLERV